MKNIINDIAAIKQYSTDKLQFLKYCIMFEEEVNDDKSYILSKNIFFNNKIASEMVLALKKIHKKLTTKKVHIVFIILMLVFVAFLFNLVILSITIIKPCNIPHKMYVKFAPCHKPLIKNTISMLI